MENVAVTVVCTAYNHAGFIKRCLDGFVMQETNFPFEVIVHDDASTDGTADIIRDYAEKYPHIIKPILQKENQYSQGKNPYLFMIPYIKGKYMASCEGDDCWIDPKKLQLQYDYMEANPDCAICVHNSIMHNVTLGTDQLRRYEFCDRDFTAEEMFRYVGGVFSTNSAFYRANLFDGMPACFNCPGVGDFQMFLYGAITGRCHYMARIMSVYNCGVPGSWTEQVSKDAEKRKLHLQQFDEMLQRVNAYYGGRFDEAIKDRRRAVEFWDAAENNDFGKMTSRKYRDLYDTFLCENYAWFRAIRDRWKKQWKSRLFGKLLGAENYAKLKRKLGKG